MNTKIETKILKTEEIKPNPKNPKKHWVEKISESIREMGYVEPIVVAENNMILAGHGRLKALKENGAEEVEVIVKRGLTEEQKEKYMLLSNKIVEEGGWNLALLAKFDESILTNAGFDDGDLDEIFGMETEDNFDFEKAFQKAVKNPRGVKSGNIWQLGEHRLVIGNCLERKNWGKVLGNEKYDFLFSDPPYAIGANMGDKKVGHAKYKFKVKTKKGFGYKGLREYEGLKERGGVPEFDEWLSIASEFQNPKGANVMIFENWKNTVKLWQAIEKYWKIRNMVIWHLPNRSQGFSASHKFFSKYDIAPLAGEGVFNQEYEQELEDYLKEKGQKLLDTYEVIIYGHRGQSYWDKKKGTKWARVNDHITWTAETESSSGQSLIFGTKPIQILTPFVKILSPRNGIIMEPYAGSGSTIIASEIMHRKCRAIEISETYAEVIIARWEKFSGKKAQKIYARQ